MKDKILFSVVIVIAFIAGILFLTKNSPQQAKPSNVSMVGWETYLDPSTGINFQYPAFIPTTYIHLVDWPPQVHLTNEAFSCTPGGSAIERGGVTREQTINGHRYCVTQAVEGAAGSTYTLYAFGTELQGKMTYFTFSLRASQCVNYDEPQRSACQNERDIFSVDSTIDQIIQSTRLPL
ncbi:MAG: hypothetical protein KBC06_02790 [Candidatus Pacebacteria bacterium]|nr:hypothetical protein [Candidatus Paceibacterota bacterium]